MKTVTIYGSSDDLIELEGDIREEYGAFESRPSYLIFDDGSAVKCEYTDEGQWKFKIESGPARIILYDVATDFEDDHSDKLTITGNFKTASIWRNNPPSMRELREYLSNCVDFRDMPESKLKRIQKIVEEVEE